MKISSFSKKDIIVLIAFFLSGFAALIYEVAWIRPIATIFQSTIYVISLVLTAFMFGLGIGSILGGKLLNRVKKPLLIYAYIEIAIGIFGILVLHSIRSLPETFQELLGESSPTKYFLSEFTAILTILIIPTTLMGATFPVLAKAYTREKIGKSIGEIYAANNAGAILGSLIAGFVLMPQLGVKNSIVIAASLNMLAGFIIVVANYPAKAKFLIPVGLIVLVTLSSAVQYSMTYIYKEGNKDFSGGRKFYYYEEGMYGTVAVANEQNEKHIRRLFVNGQGSSGLRFSDMRVSLLLGALPSLFHDDGNALSIGYGTGSTSYILNERYNTTTVEIEPKVIETSPFFRIINKRVDLDKKHNLVIDDARHYLMKGEEKYNIIVNHPLDPYQSFSTSLFTYDFYKIIADRLTPEGTFVQWFPIYSLSEEERTDFYYTLKSVFPYINVFYSRKKGEKVNLTTKFDDYPIPIVYDAYVKKDGREFILLCSFKDYNITTELIERQYEKLPENVKDLLNMVALDTASRVSNLFVPSDDVFYDKNSVGHLITDDHPTLEFTTPINRIKARGAKSD